MRPAARCSALAAACATALLGAACSGGGGDAASDAAPNRGEYVAQAKRICVDYQEQIAGLKASSNLTELAMQGERAIELQQAEIDALRELEPPPDDAPAIERMLDTMDGAAETARELVAAARAQDEAAVTSSVSVLRDQLAEANRLAKPFGLDLCTS